MPYLSLIAEQVPEKVGKDSVEPDTLQGNDNHATFFLRIFPDVKACRTYSFRKSCQCQVKQLMFTPSQRE